MQAYSSRSRERDPYALPDVEVFYCTPSEAANLMSSMGEPYEPKAGWYWWHCYPGCLPDSDPFGPFSSSKAALAAACEDTED